LALLEADGLLTFLLDAPVTAPRERSQLQNIFLAGIDDVFFIFFLFYIKCIPKLERSNQETREGKLTSTSQGGAHMRGSASTRACTARFH
jgi:hypothetical protein